MTTRVVLLISSKNDIIHFIKNTYYTGGHNCIRFIIVSFNFLLNVMVPSLGVWFNFLNFHEIKSISKGIIGKKYSKFWLQHFKNKLQ